MKDQPDHQGQLDELERRFHDGAAPPVEPEDERAQLRGTVLAQRLARRRGYGVAAAERKPRRLFGTLSLLVLAALGAWGAWGALPELRYWLSTEAPIDLGRLHAYHPEAAPDGAFVKLEGIASPKRGAYSRMWRDHEVFPLIGSRIIVDRPRAPDPSLAGYGFRFAGSGRLSRAGSDHRWEGVRATFAEAGELPREGEIYVVEEDLSPRRGLRPPVEVAFWSLLCLFCATVALRRALRKLR